MFDQAEQRMRSGGRAISIAELRTLVSGYTGAFDPAVIAPCDAEAVVTHSTAMINMLECTRSLAAKRAAEGGGWRRDGDLSPEHHLARIAGTGVGQARKSLDTAGHLPSMPELEAASRRGELSPQQAAPIADAVAKDPSAEQRLLDKAKRRSLGELLDECARTKANAEPDPDARHEAIRRSRYVRVRNTADGAAEMNCRGTKDAIATMFSIVRGRANTAFDQARLEGRQEPEEAHLFDGLEAALQASVNGGAATVAPDNDLFSAGTDAAGNSETTAGSGSDSTSNEPPAKKGRVRKPTPTKVIVRIDWTALVRGYTEGGETCEITGIGPVPVSVVREMIESGDPFLAAVLTNGVDIASVVHLGRRPTAMQVTALEWLQPSCSNEACNHTWRLETDHHEDWAKTKITWLEWLTRLCEHCHDLKTNQGWSLVHGTRKRPFVAPHDPRHPRHNKQAEDGRSPPDTS